MRPSLALAVLALCVATSAARGETHYRVEDGAGEVRILVYRAGLFSGLGHNHAVTTRALTGSVMLGDTPADSSLSLEFPVSSLTVDDAAVRAEEGKDFSSEVDADAIAGTRANMLGPRLLDAGNYNSVRIESTRVDGEFPNVTITMRITVRGSPHEVEVPVSVNVFDGGLVAIGRLRLKQSEIGLTPFQAALGSLRVADEMLVKFRVRAEAVNR